MEAEIKKLGVHYTTDASRPTTQGRSISEDGPPSKAPLLSGTDDDEEEDYDWSTDSDLVDEEAKFEHRIGFEKPQKTWRLKRIITFALSTLVGSTLLASIIVAVPLLLHFYYYKPYRSDHRKFVTENVSAWLYWTATNLLLSWYLAMIVDVIPIICVNVVELVWGEVSEDVQSRIELYNAAKDKFKPVLYGASGWASWTVIFNGIYTLYDIHDESSSWARYTARVYQAIRFLFFLTLVLCAEKILFQMIAFAFHRKAFIGRMEILKSNLQVIEHLKNYRPKRQSHRTSRSIFFPPVFGVQDNSGPNFGDGSKGRAAHPDVPSDNDGHMGDIEEGAGRSSLHPRKGKDHKSWSFSIRLSRQNTTTGSLLDASPTDRPDQEQRAHVYPPVAPSPGHAYSPGMPLHGGRSNGEPAILQVAKVLKTAILHDSRNMTGKEDDFSSLGWNFNSANEAKRTACSIYTAFRVDRHRNYLIPADFYPAYTKQADAEEAFKVFDKDNHGDISRAEIKTVVLRTYKERRALRRSLRDVNNALTTLDWIMTLLAMVILFFISLSVFHIAIGNSLTSFYTIGIAASFIFKNAASSAFDAVMFIFVTHPFDTGDRCFIDGENLIVKQMGLFATIFSRADGTETYYFNSQLFTKFITNVQRSGNMFENITLQVAWRTPMERLDQLERKMNEWLATEENRWFDPTTAVTLQKIEYQQYLEFTMAIGHNGTWQDWALRNARKTAFLAAVQFYCRQLGIVYHESLQPIFLAENEEQLATIGTHPLVGRVSLRTFSTSPGPSVPIIPETSSDIAGDERVKDTVLLGFKPPPETRSTLTRVRKSKLRKGNVRGMRS